MHVAHNASLLPIFTEKLKFGWLKSQKLKINEIALCLGWEVKKVIIQKLLCLTHTTFGRWHTTRRCKLFKVCDEKSLDVKKANRWKIEWKIQNENCIFCNSQNGLLERSFVWLMRLSYFRACVCVWFSWKNKQKFSIEEKTPMLPHHEGEIIELIPYVHRALICNACAHCMV